jgi:putative ABC transport system permease protein
MTPKAGNSSDTPRPLLSASLAPPIYPPYPPAARPMRFSSLIFKNLIRRRFRTILTLSALATAIAAVIALLGIARGFTKSFAEVYSAHGVDLVVSRQGSADRLSSSVDLGFVSRIEEIPLVDRAAGVLLETLSFEEQGVYGVPSMGMAPHCWLLDDYRLRAGVSLPIDEPKTLLLGVHLAERLQLEPGDKVDLFEEDYRVAGIFESPSIWENGSMILPLGQLQTLTDRVGQVTYINVIFRRPATAEQAAAAVQAIEALDAKLLALTTEEFVRTDTRMQLSSAMAWMTSAVAIFIGAIGTLNTMMTSVLERTREIGILRAIGWPRRRIVAMILAESCAIASIASLFGAALAIAGTWALSRAPAAKGILSPHIDARILFQGVGIALLIGLLGALLPAWRAAKLQPTEAFRDAAQ